MAQVGTRTLRLAEDGTNIAAAMQTIIELGDVNALADAIDDAFPESRIEINETDVFLNCGCIKKGCFDHSVQLSFRTAPCGFYF